MFRLTSLIAHQRQEVAFTAFLGLLTMACAGADRTGLPAISALRSMSSTVPTATAGTALTEAPTFIVTDASNNPVANVPVTVTVTGGGGSIANAPTRTQAGATPVGTWTLGTLAGPNSLNVAVSGLPPLVITATGTPGDPAKMVVAGGDAQIALAGSTAAAPLAAAVQDRYGNGIAGVQVTFQVTTGGGAISPAQIATNPSGMASGAAWRLGNKGGPQTATATAGTLSALFTASIQSTFPLTLRYFGPPMSLHAQTAFTNAANRLRAAIVLPVPQAAVQGADLSQCGVSGLSGSLTETTAGLIIYASVSAIDGPGKIVAQAGPCYIRSSSALPLVGVMQFDEADIQNYINTGRFDSVVLHEMNHVFGLGTIWFDKNLLQNSAFTNTAAPQPTGSTDPRYVGAAATASCAALGGAAALCAGGVAVEACGGVGTADGHWRKRFGSCPASGPAVGSLAFGNEVNTGFVESTANMPWSAMSILQFQDLGYTVNALAADDYVVPNLLALARLRSEEPSLSSPSEILIRPRYRVVPGGRVEALRRDAR